MQSITIENSVEDENGTETSIYIGDIVGCASEVSKKK